METARGLRRSRRDRWILGVCGGLAETYGWNPMLVRLAAMVLAILIPGPSLALSFITYLILGFSLPVRDDV